MTCTCTPCVPDTVCIHPSHNLATFAPADHTKLTADWGKFLHDLDRVCRESGQASGQNRIAYSEFLVQASAIIDGLSTQPPISPDRLLEGIEQLIVSAQSATVPDLGEYVSLSKELDAFSVEYLKHLDGKKGGQNVEGKKPEFEAEYVNMRSYIDRLKTTWTVVGEKLAEILSLLRGDTEKCDIPNYPAVQVDILDATSKFTFVKGNPTTCTGSGFCCYGC